MRQIGSILILLLVAVVIHQTRATAMAQEKPKPEVPKESAIAADKTTAAGTLATPEVSAPTKIELTELEQKTWSAEFERQRRMQVEYRVLITAIAKQEKEVNAALLALCAKYKVSSDEWGLITSEVDGRIQVEFRKQTATKPTP